MADIIWSDVTALPGASSLASTSTTAQTAILAYVNKQQSDAFDGDNGPSYLLARCFLAAHLATASKRAGAGPVTSESVGGIARSYGMLATSSFLATTPFGAQYLAILRASPARAPLVP